MRCKLLLSVIASASTSGLRLPLRSLAVLPMGSRPSSTRTSDQLQLSSRAAHQLARNAAHGLRRRSHAYGSPITQSPACAGYFILRQSWQPVSGFRWLPHLQLAPVACCPLRPFPESFSRVLVGLPACAGPQLPHSAVVRPGISSNAGSLGLRFESRSSRHPIPLTGLW